jgi:hypothetical protein
MQIFVDVQQYLLSAAALAPSTLLSYLVFYWLAKLATKALGGYFGLSFLGHAVFILVACALAPIVAIWFVARPADLLDGSGKALWAGAISALLAVAAAQEFAPQTPSGAPHGKARRILSGAAVGAISGAFAFLLFAAALANNPKSQIDFTFGSFLFFVSAGLIVGAGFIRR